MTQLLNKISKSDIRNIIAVITVLGAFIMLTLLMMIPIPAENKDIVNIGVGIVLGGLVGGVNGFYYGSSRGAKKEEHEE